MASDNAPSPPAMDSDDNVASTPTRSSDDAPDDMPRAPLLFDLDTPPAAGRSPSPTFSSPLRRFIEWEPIQIPRTPLPSFRPRKRLSSLLDSPPRRFTVPEKDELTKIKEKNEELEYEVRKLKSENEYLNSEFQKHMRLEAEIDKLKEENEALKLNISDQAKCIICLNNIRQVVFEGCKHFAICLECYVTLLENSDNRCPVCRTECWADKIYWT